MTQTLTQNKSPQRDYTILKQKINFLLNSNWALLFITLLVAFCWAVNLPEISATSLVLFEVLVLIFCKENPKALFYPIMTLIYITRSLLTTAQFIYGGILGGILVFSFLGYIIYKIKVEKTKCKKGKMFWVFIPLIIANILGGVVGHFNILMSFLVLLILVFLYGVYWFCLNFISNSQKYFAYLAIFLSLLTTLEIFIGYFFESNGFIWALTHKIAYFGGGLVNINCASIFMLTGVCACFYLATEHKKDYLFILLAIFFDLVILQGYSRTAIVLAFIISVVYFIIVVRKSINKKLLLISLGVVIGIVAIVSGIMWRQIYNLLAPYLEQGISLNGRADLWNWCIETFKNNIFFGIGYTTTDPAVLQGGAAPGMAIMGDYCFVQAHNIFLQNLTSLGIIGSLLTIPFYVQKYMVIFKKFTTYKLFVLIMFLSLFLSSLFDITYPLNFFLIFFNIAVLANAEKITTGEELDEIDEELKSLTNMELQHNIVVESGKLHESKNNKESNSLINNTTKGNNINKIEVKKNNSKDIEQNDTPKNGTISNKNDTTLQNKKDNVNKKYNLNNNKKIILKTNENKSSK